MAVLFLKFCVLILEQFNNLTWMTLSKAPTLPKVPTLPKTLNMNHRRPYSAAKSLEAAAGGHQKYV
jgi:hypothetical protein